MSSFHATFYRFPVCLISDVNNITAESFDPRPKDDMPMVVPLNQKFEVKCFKPEGLPPPMLR